MTTQTDIELSIVEYRNIVKTIKESRNYDFSDYALTSLKRRFENIMTIHNLRQPDFLIERIKEDEVFFNQFLIELAVEETEMFRDPSLWRALRNEVFPSIFRDQSTVRIWLPYSVSGDELFTLAIVLKENNWLEKAEILVSGVNEQVLDNIRNGELKTSKIDISIDNYNRYQGTGIFESYYKTQSEKAIRDVSLIKNVQFFMQNINFDNSPQDIRLVIYRNQLIYLSQSHHDKVLKILYNILAAGGYLVIGIKEQLGIVSNNYFKLFNEAENIYKRS
jgi:chemotaxis protein methyltransferase CheR